MNFLSIGHQNPKQSWYFLQGYHLKEDTGLFQLTDPEEYDFYALNREDILDITWGPLARFCVFL